MFELVARMMKRFGELQSVELRRTSGKLVVVVTVAAAVSFGVSTASGSPPGATAQCRDGTYSFSLHHSGTCSHHGGVARWLDGSSSTSSGGSPSSPSITTAPAVGRTVLIARRSRSRGCTRGARPDVRCSPGAYYSGLTRAVICSSGFRTSTIRNVSQSEKYAAETEYGMLARLYGRTIEIDHLIPLELGGSNDIANLFPEPGAGNVSYQVKDKLENRLHTMVCARQITLAGARFGIDDVQSACLPDVATGGRSRPPRR